MNDKKYYEILDKYYSLKNQYDTKYKTKVKNIIKKNKDNKNTIKKKIKNIKRYCINCDKHLRYFFKYK